jgi:hypothetical protein
MTVRWSVRTDIAPSECEIRTALPNVPNDTTHSFPHACSARPQRTSKAVDKYEEDPHSIAAALIVVSRMQAED